MGNNASSSQSQGKLTIAIDPPTSATSTGNAYFPGETISGSVYAQSKSNVHPSQINLSAYISGKERTSVHDTPHAMNTKYFVSTNSMKYTDRQVLRMTVTFGDVTTGVDAGSSYHFPFRIQLPAGLPSSMHVSGQGLSYCEINYKIKAELKGTGVFGNHKVEQKFNVLSTPLPPVPLPNLIQPNYQTIHYAGCIPAGTIAMGARVENTRVGTGEAIVVNFACKNESPRGINRAEVTIVEEVIWEEGTHAYYDVVKNIMVARTFQPNQQWNKMKKGELEKLKTSGNSQMMLQDVYNAMFDGENSVVLNMPPSSHQSYNGILITVRHRLKIKVYTDGRFTDNPRFKVPICIGTPSGLLGSHTITPVNAAPSDPPAEWTSVVTASIVDASSSIAVVGGGIKFIKPSFSNLITEIKLSMGPLAVIKTLLNQDEWKRAVFNSMTPPAYEFIIKTVNIEFKAETAALIAPAIRSGKFTHEYVVAALHVVAAWLRIPLIERLVPLCVDLEENASIILSKLSDWERVCTQQYFQDSLMR